MAESDTPSPPTGRSRRREAVEVSEGDSRPFRLLAVDGGPAGLLSTLIMQQLIEGVPDILTDLDAYVGTSSGGIAALMLASHPTTVAPVLNSLQTLWSSPAILTGGTGIPPSLVASLLGTCSFLPNTGIRKYLSLPDNLGTRTLGSLLPKLVITPSYYMNPLPVVNQAGPVIFSNDDPKNEGVLAVDAAMATSAAPLSVPVYYGYVDGGLYANTPIMVAIGEFFRLRRQQEKISGALMATTPRAKGRELLILSIGTGQPQDKVVVNGSALVPWGYLDWLLSIFDPLRLVSTAFYGGAEEIVRQAGYIMPEGNFWRLNVNYQDSGPSIPFLQANPKVLEDTAKSSQTKQAVAAAISWAKSSGWLGPLPPNGG